MAESEPTDRVAADPDAPWRPGYTGPPPRPLPRGGTPSWPPPTGGRVPDPWSREASLAAVDDPPDRPVIDDPGDPDEPGDLDGPDDSDGPGDSDGSGDCDGSDDRDGPDGADRPDRPDVSAAAAAAGGLATPAAIVVAGVAVLLALIAAAASIVWLLDDDADIAGGVRLPDSARRLWSADHEQPIADAIVTDQVVVVVGAGRIAGLDHADGSELWELDTEISRHSFASGPVDGVVLVFDVDQARAVAVDAVTGTELWTRSVPERRGLYGAHATIVEFGRGVGGGRDVTLLEPRTGRRVTERLEIASRRAEGRFIPVHVDGAIRLLDLEERAFVGPELDGAAVTPLVSATISDGAVVATDAQGALVLFDDAGQVADRIEIDQSSPSAGLEVVDVPGADVVAARAESAFGIRAHDGSLDVLWSRERHLESIGPTEDGPRMLLSGADGLTVADAVTGADEALLRASAPDELRVQLAGNGVLVRGGDTLVGFDLDGARRWSIDAGFDRFVAGPDLVVTLRGDTITAFG